MPHSPKLTRTGKDSWIDQKEGRVKNSVSWSMTEHVIFLNKNLRIRFNHSNVTPEAQIEATATVRAKSEEKVASV
jgi:hypothetical protein